MAKAKTIPAGYWPCACVKRDRQGNMKAVKMNPPAANQCRVCGSQKPTALPEKVTN